MAMNIHQEARRRQMHMDRVCEVRRKMASTNMDVQPTGPGTNGTTDPDPLMCSDQGQFFQTRLPSQSKFREEIGQEEELSNAEKKRSWNHPRKIRQKTPEPKPCPPSLHGVKRDKIYKILHPHTEY